MLRVGVEQPSDHALVLRIVFTRFVFEEFDAAFTQGNGHLYTFAEIENAAAPRWCQ